MSSKKSNKLSVEKSTEKKQVKPPIEVSVEEPLVAIQSLRRHIRYIYKSPYTGKEYIWEKARAGSVVDVPKEDAEVLLAKTRKVGCCGSETRTMHIFIRR